MSQEKKLLRKRFGLLIVLALMYLYSAYFTALSMQLHATFRTRASDMGQMDQALWNTLHGHWLEDTRPNGKQLPRLTDHVELIFFVVPFVFLIHDGIESLFVLQSIVIALGALPIYWIARRRLKSEWVSVIFAAMYLLYPALQAANLAEFHAVTFAPAPLMLMYNYGEERAWKRFALFALIALGVKEDIALLVLAMAVYFAVQSPVTDHRSTDKTVAASGAAPDDSAWGVHLAISERIAALAERIGIAAPAVMTGGVAKNPAARKALEDRFRIRFLVPQEPQLAGALGAALIALDRRRSPH